MKYVGVILGFLCALSIGLIFPVHAVFGMAKTRKHVVQPLPANITGPKKIVALDPIDERFIELPNPEPLVRKYGPDLCLRLVTEMDRLQESVVLLDPVKQCGGKSSDQVLLSDVRLQAQSMNAQPDPILVDVTPEASTKISIELDELSFVTGERGERMFYGYRRGFSNPYNDGKSKSAFNEYPLRITFGFGDEPGWFQNEFSEWGNLRTGLELGHEANFEAIVAGADLKYANYSATMGMKIHFQNQFKPHEDRYVSVSGKGFYFDLTMHAAYQGGDYMLGLMLARRFAMLKAFDRVINGALSVIQKEIEAQPLVTRVVALQPQADGSVTAYIGLGANFRIESGQRFYNKTLLDENRMQVEAKVENVYQRISSVTVQKEHLDHFRIGQKLVSLTRWEQIPKPAPEVLVMGLGTALSTVQNVDLGNQDFLNPKDLPPELQKFNKAGSFLAYLSRLKDTFTLPYRIWRYSQFDQEYKGTKQAARLDGSRAMHLAKDNWALNYIGASKSWANYGMGNRAVTVAILDSGLDYNHPEFAANVFFDAKNNSPGWDFISWDKKPFDDHSHGTEVASVIAGGGARTVGVAPQASLMPLKVFSPYGVTHSGQIYAAVDYAIQNGAKILVLGWASPKYSKAVEDAVAKAVAAGLLVVMAAGDSGIALEKTEFYPASLKNSKFQNQPVLVVGGIDQYGNRAKNSLFHSNFSDVKNGGQIGDGVDFLLPGEDVLVARPRGEYARSGHTGIAAGVMAGAAALAWSICPQAKASQIHAAFKASTLTSFGTNPRFFLPTVLEKVRAGCVTN